MHRKEFDDPLEKKTSKPPEMSITIQTAERLSKMSRVRILVVFPLAVFLCAFLGAKKGVSSAVTNSEQAQRPHGAYYTGVYHNLFVELLDKSASQVQTRIDSSFNQLFYGDSATQRVYYPVETDMAYVEDIAHNDVRTEGMSYGMMIAVQLDKKAEFDRIWKWAKTFMQHRAGPRKNYFAWHCRTNGAVLDSTAASDGEEWFVTSLFFAAARWGNGEGMFNYKAEAQIILDAMLNKESAPDNDRRITNMFNRKEMQVVFVPSIQGADFTDPSYHLPHYYELWARWADKNNQFWCSAASTSRQFLKKAAHALTGLTPDYAHFDGTPMSRFGGGSDDFRYDAWRVAMNVAVDFVWFAKNPWEATQSNRLLEFFYSQGLKTYGSLFTLDGKKLSDDHSAGLVAMNAVACLASTDEHRKDFVGELWDTPTPSGHYRYYDGLLYMLGTLQVSGNFKIYELTGNPITACPD